MRNVSLFLFLLILTAGADQVHSQSCPVITINSPGIERGQKTSSTASVTGAASAKLTFKWTVSPGRIIGGQGTGSIVVDAKEAAGRTLTISVEVGGIPDGCENKASLSMIYCDLVAARKFDEYGDLTWQEEKARLDLFGVQLEEMTQNESAHERKLDSSAKRRLRNRKRSLSTLFRD